MKRREFIALAGGVSVTWPLAARVQQTSRPRRVGFLMGYSDGSPQARIAVSAFDEGLKNVGLRVGRDLLIDYRWAGGDPEKARAFARELIALQPDLIVASTNQVVSILMAETTTIPIVFVFIGDPPAVSPHIEFLQFAQATAPSFGFGLVPIPVTNPQEIEERIGAFATSGSR